MGLSPNAAVTLWHQDIHLIHTFYEVDGIDMDMDIFSNRSKSRNRQIIDSVTELKDGPGALVALLKIRDDPLVHFLPANKRQ
jgi:hypothetical protein